MAQSAVSSAVDVSSAVFSSHAIFADGVSSSVLEIDADPGAVAVSVEFLKTGLPFPHLTAMGHPSPTSVLQLFDDGTNGDEIPLDGVFTVGGIRSLYSDFPAEGFVRLTMEIDVDGTITHLFAPAFSVTRDEGFGYELTGPNVLRSDYLVNIFGQPIQFREDIHAISQFFFERFPDEYDFLLLYREKVPGNHGFFNPVRNAVSGIGLPLYDNSQHYGSNGVLQGIAEFGTTDW
jgi:hypothetical protein